jgi:hypothetical protein
MKEFIQTSINALEGQISTLGAAAEQTDNNNSKRLVSCAVSYIETAKLYLKEAKDLGYTEFILESPKGIVHRDSSSDVQEYAEQFAQSQRKGVSDEEIENLEYEWQDATKEKPCPAIGFKNLSPKVMVKTPLGVGTGYHNSSDNDWLVNIIYTEKSFNPTRVLLIGSL